MHNLELLYVLLVIGGISIILYVAFLLYLKKHHDRQLSHIVFQYNIIGFINCVIYGFTHNLFVNPHYYNALLKLDFGNIGLQSFIAVWAWRAGLYFLIFSYIIWKTLGSQKTRENPKKIFGYFVLYSVILSTAWITDFEKLLFNGDSIDILHILHWVGGIIACVMFYFMQLVFIEKKIARYLNMKGQFYRIRNRSLVIYIGTVVMLLFALFSIIIGGMGYDTPESLITKLSIISIFFLIPLFIIIVKNTDILSENVEKTVNFLKQVSRRDLTQKVDVFSLDEFSELRESLKQLRNSFQSIIGSARNTSGEIAASAGEIEGSLSELAVRIQSYNEELNRYTVTQTSTADDAGKNLNDNSIKLNSVVEIIGQQSNVVRDNSKVIESITKNIKGLSEKTRSASGISEKLFNVAEEGGRLIDETLGSIQAIETSSQEISEITGVIDEIAEETGMLAMNAAIEASHAGESGRGFAIVAQEMRKLAENSSRNAASISRILGDIMKKVNHALDRMKASREGFLNIHREVDNNRAVNTQIADAMENQTGPLNDVLSTTVRLEKITDEIRNASEHFRESNNVMKDVFGQIKSIAMEEKEATRKSSDFVIGSIDGMRSIIEANLKVANQLNELISLFKLESREESAVGISMSEAN